MDLDLRTLNANELRALEAYANPTREELCAALWILRAAMPRVGEVSAEDRRWFHEKADALLDRRPEAMHRHPLRGAPGR